MPASGSEYPSLPDPLNGMTEIMINGLKNPSNRAELAAVSFVAVCLGLTGYILGLSYGGRGTVDDGYVRSIVREEIRENPKLLIKAIEGYMREEQQREARQSNEQAISKKADIAALEGFPYIGNSEAPITLVYFFDSNCIYCKKIDPVLKRIVSENADVKIAHREIPILAETSRLAAHVANMVWEVHSHRYADFHDRLLGHKGVLSADDIEKYLKESLGEEDANALLARVDNENDEVVTVANNRVMENLAISQAAGIRGTPFVYVLQGDGLIRGASDTAYDEIMAAIAKAREN